LLILGVSSFVVAIYYLIKYLEVPQQLLPDNLFSPGSYKDLFQSIYKKWIQRMSKGFTNILADTVIIHLGMFLCLVIHLLVWVYYDKLKPTPWKEEEIED